MSETTSSPEPETGPVATGPPPPAYVERGPYREPHRRRGLLAVAAAVLIAAGTVFIVAVIFFTGFILGAHSGGHRGGEGHRGHHDSAMMEHHGPGAMPRGQFERPIGPFGGPGGPGGPYFQPPQPSQPGGPTTTAPARP
jgi:hypothetical protein